LLCDSQNDLNRLERKLEFLKSRSVDGIVVFHVEENLEILQKIKDSGIGFKYNFNNFDELCKEINKNKGKMIDMSLMPNRNVKDEFVLWLATVFATITDKVIVEIPKVSPLSPKLENNGEAISAYLRSKEFNQTT